LQSLQRGVEPVKETNMTQAQQQAAGTSLYRRTLVPDSPWKRRSPAFRKNFTTGIWVLTWGALVLGYQDVFYWKAAIVITAIQALVVLALVGFRPLVFPAQLRIAYIGWLTLGTFVPELIAMMPITTVGLGAMLAFGYCPLARMLYLLPWNRTQKLSWHLVAQAALQPPSPGRFAVKPPAPVAVHADAALLSSAS
jgi:hypothetical protein